MGRFCDTRMPSRVGSSGGSVKAAGLGDGAKPGEPLSAHEMEKSAIAKLTLDAATRHARALLFTDSQRT